LESCAKGIAWLSCTEENASKSDSSVAPASSVKYKQALSILVQKELTEDSNSERNQCLLAGRKGAYAKKLLSYACQTEVMFFT